jgi:MFS family permease
MADDLLDIVEHEVTNNASPDDIHAKLEKQGYLAEDIETAIQKVQDRQGKQSKDRRLAQIFSTKEAFDRFGYGFVPHQFMNILFHLIGANLFMLGVVNGAKSIISIVLSSIFQEYSKAKPVKKSIVSVSGYLFGFSFIGLSFAIWFESVPAFAAFLLLSAAGIVSHGDLYNKFVRDRLKKERMNKFLKKMGQYGVMITAISMLISSYLLERFPRTGEETITFLGTTYPVFGYLISFEITAIAFIMSGYFVSLVEETTDTKQATRFLHTYWEKIKVYLSTFLQNKKLFLLIMTSIIVGFTQVIGNAYYGVYIYENFKTMWLGGFINVGIIYFIAVIASLFGPWFSRTMQDTTGLAPTLVFGSLLSALLPLVLAYNPNLLAIGAANAVTVIGGSILGVSQGLLARNLLFEDERRVYFSIASLAGVVPFLILFPLASWYAGTFGLEALFKIIAAILIVVVAPLYVTLVVMGDES